MRNAAITAKSTFSYMNGYGYSANLIKSQVAWSKKCIWEPDWKNRSRNNFHYSHLLPPTLSLLYQVPSVPGLVPKFDRWVEQALPANTVSDRLWKILSYLEAVFSWHELLSFALVGRLHTGPGRLRGCGSASGFISTFTEVKICHLNTDLITHYVLELQEEWESRKKRLK